MTALIAIGIILAVVALVALVLFIYRKSIERYQVNPFSLGKFAFIAVAVAMAGIGWWASEPGGGYLLDSGLNTTVLYIAAGLMYVGQTFWLIRRTNIYIGLAAPAFMSALSATILAIIVFILLHGSGRKKGQGNDD